MNKPIDKTSLTKTSDFMNQLTNIIKPFATAALLLSASAMSAQFIIVRPPKNLSPQGSSAQNITQAASQIKESKAKTSARSSAKQRRRTRPNTSTPARPLPPLEFTKSEDLAENTTPLLNPDYFTAPRPQSRGSEIASSTLRSIPVGNLACRLPECITIFESGPDFYSGAMNNLLEIDSWMLDPTYKLSTPQAYAKYIGQLYGGIELTQTDGNRMTISGYDTKSNRNYHVAMVTEGDKLYVTRIIYRPAIERQVSEIIVPNLLIPSDSAI